MDSKRDNSIYRQNLALTCYRLVAKRMYFWDRQVTGILQQPNPLETMTFALHINTFCMTMLISFDLEGASSHTREKSSLRIG